MTSALPSAFSLCAAEAGVGARRLRPRRRTLVSRGSRASRCVANELRHAIAANLAGFSFRRAYSQEIARKHTFSMRTTNWISTPLCNDAADKLYWRCN